MNEKCQPGLYPKSGPGEDAPESEKKVYRSLKDDLPSNFFAWHSLKLRTSQGQFAETDFLIADPNQAVTDLRYVSDKYSVRMNIAASRAMSVLRIVGAEQEIEKDTLLRRFS
jgi:hypothetical protein